jgi:glucosyl-3-phosphoglycerate synthase
VISSDQLSHRIDAWLAANTFHHRDFSDLKALAEEKSRKGLTISLGIPTLNEEKTIGRIVSVLKGELMDRCPLVDEIAVIDSGSTDATREVAAKVGADVFLSREILPEQGSFRGKGENLWKAAHQLRGEIVCYVDGDIENIHPRFVAGLVGPLIRHDSIGYAKAFYERPLAHSTGLHPSGGGRVTEILVRPLFSLFFPELTAFVQPLAGEYAIRRGILERLRFPVGYGVETAHLIDVSRGWGLDAICQTDLDTRVHRNQSTHDLGKMAFEILQVLLRRLEAGGMAVPDFSTTLRQFTTEGDRCRQTLTEIVENERPPLIDLPSYCSR